MCPPRWSVLPSVQEGTVGVPPRVALCLTKAGVDPASDLRGRFPEKR